MLRKHCCNDLTERLVNPLNSEFEAMNQQNDDIENVSLRNHKDMKKHLIPQPTSAFIGASWAL